MASIISSVTLQFVAITNARYSIVVCLDNDSKGYLGECKYLIISEKNETIAKFADYVKANEYSKQLLKETY